MIILTDRLQLDRQLGDSVEKVLGAHDVQLLRCSCSAELQRALDRDSCEKNTSHRPRAILTTLQKFVSIAKSLNSPVGKREDAQNSALVWGKERARGGGEWL